MTDTERAKNQALIMYTILSRGEGLDANRAALDAIYIAWLYGAEHESLGEIVDAVLSALSRDDQSFRVGLAHNGSTR